MKKIITILMTMLAMVLPVHAVLKEQTLARSIAVLRAEMERSYKEQHSMKQLYGMLTKIQHERIMQTLSESNQVGLMLYSQKEDYTFDLTYACHEAIEQYKNFSESRRPYTSMTDAMNIEKDRYTELVSTLEAIPPMTQARRDSMRARMAREMNIDSLRKEMAKRPRVKLDSAQKARMKGFMLDERAQGDREICLIYANALLKDIEDMIEQMEADNSQYEMVEKRLKKNYDYAIARYERLQDEIYNEGGENLLTILKRLPMYAGIAFMEIADKYAPVSDQRLESDWRGSMVFSVFFFVLFYLAVGYGISYLLVNRFLLKNKTVAEKFDIDKIAAKRQYIIALCSVALCAALMIGMSFKNQNFVVLACRLTIEFLWLAAAILLSMIVRLKSDEIKYGLLLNLPILVLGFFIITFRIIFIPGGVVNLLFPALLLAFAIWQYCMIRKYAGKIEVSHYDRVFAWFSFLVILFACGLSWVGYSLLAIQILIWWLFQLTCIQTVMCIYDIVSAVELRFLLKRMVEDENAQRDYRRQMGDKTVPEGYYTKEDAREDLHKKENRGKYIKKTWAYDLFRICLVPVFAVLSLVFSIYYASDVFNMTESCRMIFFKNFIDVPDVIQLSLFKITLSVAFFFIFRYVNYVLKSIYKNKKLGGAVLPVAGKPEGEKTEKTAQQEARAQKKIAENSVANSQASIALFDNISSIIIWGGYFVLLLNLLQVPKSGIAVVTAGLSTGVGFAMKGLLENFFYGISLMSGRVRVGEWIECDGIRGQVDSISYQSTQVRTLDGSIIAFMNSSLFSKNFKNLTKTDDYEFQVVEVGIAYGSDVENARHELNKGLRNDLKSFHKKTPDGRDWIMQEKGFSVVVSGLGDNSVNLKVAFWCLVEKKFWVNSDVIECIYNTLNKANISIPFPQRDVHIIKDIEVAPAK